MSDIKSAHRQAINWEKMPRETVRPGVERAGFRGDNALLVMNWLSPGMEVRPHAHPFDQIAYVVKGRMLFTVGSEKIEVSAGEVIHIPRDVVHCGEVLGDEIVHNLDVFSPLREDYRHLTVYQEGSFDR
jgi:quercetin dioxygenase-like cupin family protein